MSGAITGVTRLLFADPPLLSAEDRARAEDALISTAPNVQRGGDPQTGNKYASALGGVRDPRARDLLWDFVNRNVLVEQSLMAITWSKNPADLPRFAALLESPVKGDEMQRTYASLPFAIRRAYGDAALAVLESALQKSGHVWVRTNCARELVEAGRKSGFAFIAQAIEQDKFYRREDDAVCPGALSGTARRGRQQGLGVPQSAPMTRGIAAVQSIAAPAPNFDSAPIAR